MVRAAPAGRWLVAVDGRAEHTSLGPGCPRESGRAVPGAGPGRPGCQDSGVPTEESSRVETGTEGCSRRPGARILRELWRHGLVGRACLLSPGTTGSMKTPVELAISGMQTLHRQHRCRGGYQVKARASYVDETLFGSPSGTRPTAPDFDPPWVEKANRPKGVGREAPRASGANGSCETTSSRGSTPTLTPRKKNKYRLISHTPSYCDESLFGSRPVGTCWEAPWMVKGGASKLHTLFWTPPATPRGHPPHPRETPVRTIHPSAPTKTEPREGSEAGKVSKGGLDSPRALNVPSTGRPPTGGSPTSGPRDPRPSPSGVTFRSPLVTPRARSVSASVPATSQRGGATPRPKPPWK